MGYFALVKSSVVTAVIVADQNFIDAASLEMLGADLVVDVTENRPGPGFSYDAGTGLFTAPPPVEE